MVSTSTLLSWSHRGEAPDIGAFGVGKCGGAATFVAAWPEMFPTSGTFNLVRLLPRISRVLSESVPGPNPIKPRFSRVLLKRFPGTLRAKPWFFRGFYPERSRERNG